MSANKAIGPLRNGVPMRNKAAFRHLVLVLISWCEYNGEYATPEKIEHYSRLSHKQCSTVLSELWTQGMIVSEVLGDIRFYKVPESIKRSELVDWEFVRESLGRDVD
jgi:hypothetical protein